MNRFAPLTTFLGLPLLLVGTALGQPPMLPMPPAIATLYPAPPPVAIIASPMDLTPPRSHKSGVKSIGRLLEPLRPPGVVNAPAAMGPGLLGAAHHHLQPQPATPTVPGAVPMPRSKTPYSYGYFGPTASRRWTKSYGYRDRSIRWTLQ